MSSFPGELRKLGLEASNRGATLDDIALAWGKGRSVVHEHLAKEDQIEIALRRDLAFAVMNVNTLTTVHHDGIDEDLEDKLLLWLEHVEAAIPVPSQTLEESLVAESDALDDVLIEMPQDEFERLKPTLQHLLGPGFVNELIRRRNERWGW